MSGSFKEELLGTVTRRKVLVDEMDSVASASYRPGVVWFTGLSGAGKTTIAELVQSSLGSEGVPTYLLDGDILRGDLNSDLGFSDADRTENVRRITAVAALMMDAGIVVLVAVISPFEAERRRARQRVGHDAFMEVFVDTPLDVAEDRDPKGLYARARAGQLPNFTGIDSPYERPASPEIRIDTTVVSAMEAADMVLDAMRDRKLAP
jgi:bifunctional enzyme CysN/CysC